MKTFIVVVMLALLVAACAKTGQPAAPEQTPTVETGGDIKVQTGAGEQQGALATNAAQKELEEIFKKGETLEFSVDYAMTSDVGGETQQSDLALYVKGKKLRTDISGPEGDVRTYVLDDGKYVMCSQQDAEWSCLSLDAPQEETPNLQEDYERNADEFWNDRSVLAAPDRTIAGTKAKCYKMTSTIVDGEGPWSWEVCASKEGVMLFTQATTPQGTITQEAKSYKTSVPADAFTPPATPQSMGDLTKGYGGYPME